MRLEHFLDPPHPGHLLENLTGLNSDFPKSSKSTKKVGTERKGEKKKRKNKEESNE